MTVLGHGLIFQPVLDIPLYKQTEGRERDREREKERERWGRGGGER